MSCGCTTVAIPRARWQEAQDAERGYWYSADPVTQMRRREEETNRATWVARHLLDITPDTVARRTVLDIGGGPQPISAWPALSLGASTLLEPMAIASDDQAAWPTTLLWVRSTAEGYVGPSVDEVWGYNVLQHVQSPRLVLECAKRHAVQRIRWFEWINQPASVVHPHVITPKTFSPFAGLRVARYEEGTRDEGRGWTQQYVAGVWEVA